MIEHAQEVEIVTNDAGGIEAVLLPYSARNGNGRRVVRAANFFAAEALVPAGIVSVALGDLWDSLVVCTREFEAFTLSAAPVLRPASQHRIFFTRG
ncbi:MAG: hypothetical protein WC205_04095 [Opitutaceae bacterium]|jgi:hypothetical protein